MNTKLIMHTFRAFQGLSINEFSGLQFDHQHSFDIQTGEQVNKAMSLLISIGIKIKFDRIEK